MKRLAQYGSWDPSLEAKAREVLALRYSELSDSLDFARCQRADGTFYGTSGTCRKGTPVGPKEMNALKKAAASGNKKAKAALDVVEGKKTKEEVKKELGGASPKAKAAKDPKEEYAALLKKQQELVQKGDIASAMKLNDKIKAAAGRVKESPEAKAQDAKLKKDAESRKKAEESFEAAQKKREEGQLAANLTAKDKKVISDYTKETGGQSPRSYDNMNGCLRFPPSCQDPETSKQFVKEFDAALKKLPKNDDGNEFYRGIQVNSGQTEQLFKALENAKPGTKMKDPGYGSYSAERRQAERFTSRFRPNIIFITRNKSMTPINMYSEVKEENEAILPRGTEQVIRSVKREGKNLIVELD